MKEHRYFFGILKDFQGIGFLIKLDNPPIMNKEYVVIEFLFLWVKFWYSYEK
jgi:hypothetical protein